MTLIATTYCTEAQIIRRYGAESVVNWADHDTDGVADTGVVDDAINQATEEIDMYARQKYSQAGLATSTLINRWCVTLAAYFLAMNRANPIPSVLAEEFTRIMADLVLIAECKLQLPGVALNGDLRPTMSNVRVDRRYRHSTIRVTKPNSTNAPSVLTQDFAVEPPAILD